MTKISKEPKVPVIGFSLDNALRLRKNACKYLRRSMTNYRPILYRIVESLGKKLLESVPNRLLRCAKRLQLYLPRRPARGRDQGRQQANRLVIRPGGKHPIVGIMQTENVKLQKPNAHENCLISQKLKPKQRHRERRGHRSRSPLLVFVGQ